MSTRPPEGERASAEQELRKAGQDAGEYASEAVEAARRRGHEELDGARRGAADKTEQLADAIDRTADELGAEDDPLSGYGHSMASMMRRLAGGLRENDIEDFASELTGFARRNPGMFLAGSVALGFGLSRFLKASSPRSSYDHDNGDDDAYGFEDNYSDDDTYGYEQSGLHLRSSMAETEYGADDSAVGGGRSEHWPEDRETRGAAAEYPPHATGQPAGAAGEPEALKRTTSGEGGSSQAGPAGGGNTERTNPGGAHRE